MAASVLFRNLNSRQNLLVSCWQKWSNLSSLSISSWQCHQYGDIKELKLNTSAVIPPIRNPNELLVEVHAASVNNIDLLMLRGYGVKLFNFLRKREFGSSFTLEFPLTLGRDFSGVVLETGKNVKEFNPGDNVWGALFPQFQGTHSQRCLVPYNSVTKKPQRLTHVEAASIPYAGLTAWSALSLSAGLNEKTAPNKKVLILGGSGGVGTVAIQLLKAWNATVFTTCSTDAVPKLSSLGADAVIDYQNADYEQQLKNLPSVDVVLDARPPFTPSVIDLLTPTEKTCKYVTITSPLLRYLDASGLLLGGCRAIGHLASDLLKYRRKRFSFRWAYFTASKKGLQTLTELVEREKIRPVLCKVVPFQEAPSAYKKVLKGHLRGKTVIQIK